MKKFLILFLFGILVLTGCGTKSEPKLTETATAPSEPESLPPQPEFGTEGNFESPPGVVEGNIVVQFPKPGDTVSFPFKAYGKARVFESQFNWRLQDSNGKVIGQGTATANSPDMGKYGPFEIEVGFAETNGNSATLEVFDFSAKDGSEQDLVSVPVKIEQTASIGIKLFFANDRLDPEVSCDKVFSIDRSIPKTKSVAMATLQELLKGTSAGNEKLGFKTVINPGVKINRLAIVNGVAQVDFDSTLEYQVGGSCRVGIIRRQIEETLRQFPAVKSVAISIDGKSGDMILQP